MQKGSNYTKYYSMRGIKGNIRKWLAFVLGRVCLGLGEACLGLLVQVGCEIQAQGHVWDKVWVGAQDKGLGQGAGWPAADWLASWLAAGWLLLASLLLQAGLQRFHPGNCGACASPSSGAL